MGDMFSSKKTSSTQTTNNNQVALQGSGQVGRVEGSGNTINISNAGEASIYSQRDVSLAAIQQMGQASVAAVHDALTESANTAAVAARSFDTADNALAVAQGVANGAQQSVIYVLGALKDVQNSANETTQMAVAAAQQTALQAAPVSPGSYAEAIGGQQAQFTKEIIVGAVLVALGLGAVVYFANRK